MAGEQLDPHFRTSDTGGKIAEERSGNWSMGILAVATLHFICCGLPLLLLSGVSLAFVAPYWPIGAGILGIVGIIGFVWYLRRGCATCPRNEGRCQAARTDLAP